MGIIIFFATFLSFVAVVAPFVMLGCAGYMIGRKKEPEIVLKAIALVALVTGLGLSWMFATWSLGWDYGAFVGGGLLIFWALGGGLLWQKLYDLSRAHHFPAEAAQSADAKPVRAVERAS